jgi:hypothetical protein
MRAEGRQMLRFQRRGVQRLRTSARTADTNSGHHHLDSWDSADAYSDIATTGAGNSAPFKTHAYTESQRTEHSRVQYANAYSRST